MQFAEHKVNLEDLDIKLAFLLGQVFVYLNLLNNRVKDIANLDIGISKLDIISGIVGKIENYVLEKGCKTYLYHVVGTRYQLFLYRPDAEDKFQELLKLNAKTGKYKNISAEEIHRLQGEFFGYSKKSIEYFLKKR